MRPVLAVCGILLALAVPLRAEDTLSEARRLYNFGQYENAERMAREAAKVPATANAAGVVLGRIQLEQYRRSSAPKDLVEARATLIAVDRRALEPRERIELMIGLAEALYLEDEFGAAAELFGSVLDSSGTLGPPAHDRVLDWWATAIDRQAQTRALTERTAFYDRVAARMTSEVAKDLGSGPANFWLVAATRASGDLDHAWQLAMAAWAIAPFGRDRGAALRADLDRLVLLAIIPDRAARLLPRDRTSGAAGMQGEWEAFKARWTK